MKFKKNNIKEYLFNVLVKSKFKLIKQLSLGLLDILETYDTWLSYIAGNNKLKLSNFWEDLIYKGKIK